MKATLLLPATCLPARSRSRWRRIIAKAGDEPSVILNRVDESADLAYGYNAASREYGDLLQMGVIDPVKVTRLALQNAGSIAALILTTDCMIANPPPPKGAAGGAMAPMPDAEMA